MSTIFFLVLKCACVCTCLGSIYYTKFNFVHIQKTINVLSLIYTVLYGSIYNIWKSLHIKRRSLGLIKWLKHTICSVRKYK